MKYSDELIDRVRSANDIVDVIGERVNLKRSGSRYTGLCPFHNEKTPSFSVDRSSQLFYCFGCHAGGTVFHFKMRYDNMTFPEAVESLAERAGIQLPKREESKSDKEKAGRREKLLEIYKAAAIFYYGQLRKQGAEPARKYLSGRKVSEKMVHDFGIGYSPQNGGLYSLLKEKGYSDELLEASGLFTFRENQGVYDKFWNRIMFPISDSRGRVIAFGGRVMGDGKPKYLNSPETEIFNKRRNLYGLNIARSSRLGYKILCEGYMDVISLHQAGFDCAVASLGTALTGEQVSLLRRFTDKVLLIYDSDAAGQNATRLALPLLKRAGMSVRSVSLAPCKDPDEFLKAYGAEALNARFAEAVDTTLYAIDSLKARYDMDDPRQKTEFQREMAGVIAQIPDELERANYIEAAAKREGMTKRTLEREVEKQLARGTAAERYAEAGESTPYSGRRAAKEDGRVTTQRFMLTLLSRYREAYEQTKELIGPEDFTDPVCRKAAELLYAQLKAGKCDVAKLLDSCEDPDEASAMGGIFHAELPLEDGAQADKAFAETVYRIMKDAGSAGGDVSREGLLRQVKRKKFLENFGEVEAKLHIPFKPE